MAWITVEVDNMLEVDADDFGYREIEGIIVKDSKGRMKKYKLLAMMPIVTTYMRKLFPDTDWDETNCHIELLKGKDITTKK